MIGTLAWTGIDRFGQQLIQFAVGIILARILAPSEYTLIALVMIFITLSNTLVDGGFGYSLVRKKEITEKEISTVFIFNIGVSLFLYLLLFFTAPFIASFYSQPDLTMVARVVFIAILVNAFYLIPSILLVRSLNFKAITTVNVTSVVLSGSIAIIIAINGGKVWALVIQQLAYPFFRILTAMFFVKWMPRFQFSIKILRNFFSYSVSMLGTSILNNIFNYIYILIIGKYFSKTEVGFYYQANKLNETTNFSFQTILGSTYNVFVKIQDDTERFKRVFRELIRKSSIVIFPLLFFLIAAADPIINVLLTEKWVDSIKYFQLLSFASLLNPLYTLIISALNARGKSNTTFYLEFLKKVFILVSVVICLNFGVYYLLIGLAFANFTATGFAVIAIKREIMHFWKHQLIDILPSILIGTIILAASFGLSYLIHLKLLLLIIQIIASAIIYITGVRIFHKDLYFSVISQIKNTTNRWR